MKVLVIAGFLGSGKTSFIQEIIKKTKRNYVILENEFGQVSVDSQKLKENIKIDLYEINNSCICCSTNSDFSQSLLVIENSLHPDFLIVEPSGVAMLSKIKEKIKTVEYERIELLEPVSIIDAKNYFTQKKLYQDVLLDQIQNSKYIQLTKVEGLEEEYLLDIKEDLLSINKDLVININDYKTEDIKYFDKIFSNKQLNNEIFISEKILNLKSFTLKNIRMDSINSFISFLEKIIHSYYGNIYRSKGVVKIDDYNLIYDVVNKTYQFSFIDSLENNIVLIGDDINIEKVEEDIKHSNNK